MDEELEKAAAEARSHFGAQMALHVARNLVSMGVLPIDVALANVDETNQHLSRSQPDRAHVFAELARQWRASLQSSVDQAP